MAKMKLTFDQWLRQVDLAVQAICGLGRDDLPDCCYRDWYDDGCSPINAAKRAIRAAKDEMGF